MKAMVVVFALIGACDRKADPEPLVAGGSLISIAEGEHRTLSLAASSELGSDTPTWAHFATDANGAIDHTALVLEPPCTFITGTDGPARVVELDLVPAGGTPALVVVEVNASGSGECMPTLSGSITTVPRTGMNSDGAHPCNVIATNQPGDPITGGRIDVSYSDQTALDRALVFTLINPDPADVLDARFTSNAPIKFHRSTRVADTYCATLPNDNITGGFDLDYAIMRTTDQTSPTVAGGHYLLDWNNRSADLLAYGAEVVWCASSGSECKLTRTFTPASQWCVDRDPNARVTIGFRVWALSGSQVGNPYDLTIGATWETPPSGMIQIVAPPMTGAGKVTFRADNDSIPFDALLDLGAAPDGVIALTLMGSVVPGGMLDPPFTILWSTSIGLGCH